MAEEYPDKLLAMNLAPIFSLLPTSTVWSLGVDECWLLAPSTDMEAVKHFY